MPAAFPFDMLIKCSCGAAFLLFGYDQGVMSGLLTGNAFTAQFPEIGERGPCHDGSSGGTFADLSRHYRRRLGLGISTGHSRCHLRDRMSFRFDLSVRELQLDWITLTAQSLSSAERCSDEDELSCSAARCSLSVRPFRRRHTVFLK